MEAELAHNLISLGSAFAGAKKLKLSTVGRMCAGDGRFFSRIEEGLTFTAKKYDEVVGWFEANWPDQVDWPETVQRPKVAA
jgi:hypothetical protein